MWSSSSTSEDGTCDTFSSLTTDDSFEISTPPLSSPQPESPGPFPDQAVFSFPNQDHTKTLLVRSLGPGVCPKYIRELFLPCGYIKSLRVLWERDVDTIAAIEFEEQRSAEKAMSEIDQITKNNWQDRYAKANAIMTTTTVSGGDVRGEAEAEDFRRDAEDVREDVEDARGDEEQWSAENVMSEIEQITNKQCEDPYENTKTKTIVNKEERKQFTLFIGNATNLTEEDLLEAFQRFGNIKRVFVMRSHSYAFVTYADEASARDAIREMNGARVKNAIVFVEWDRGRKVKKKTEDESERQREYEKISKKASPDNTSIICTYKEGVLTDQLLRKKFTPFGIITALKCFTEEGYGFVRFQERSSAIQAIYELNGVKTSNGGMVSVVWKKRQYVN